MCPPGNAVHANPGSASTPRLSWISTPVLSRTAGDAGKRTGDKDYRRRHHDAIGHGFGTYNAPPSVQRPLLRTTALAASVIGLPASSPLFCWLSTRSNFGDRPPHSGQSRHAGRVFDHPQCLHRPAAGKRNDLAIEKVAFGPGQEQHGLRALATGGQARGRVFGHSLAKLRCLAILHGPIGDVVY